MFSLTQSSATLILYPQHGFAVVQCCMPFGDLVVPGLMGTGDGVNCVTMRWAGLSLSVSFCLSFICFLFSISFFTAWYSGLFILYDNFQRCGLDFGTYRCPNESVFWLAGGGVGGLSGGGTNLCSYFLKFSGGSMFPVKSIKTNPFTLRSESLCFDITSLLLYQNYEDKF